MNMWKYKKEGLINSNVFCDLYKCCKKINAQDLRHGTKTKTQQAIQNELNLSLDSNKTLITHAGDWGIKKTQCNISFDSIYSYTIEDAAHGGVYFNIEIDSILPHVRRWYMTNMGQFLHRKIYPLPIGVNHGEDWNAIDIQELRSIPKEYLCYANFTITSPYRIRVAEWCWQQQFIDCNFPKRYDTQDVELNMGILKGDRMPFVDFMKVLASYNFAISPTGNGLDTFRTWECILCNTVPVAMDNWMNRIFSKIWPMILVSRYEFSNVYKLIQDFYEEHGQVDYDYSLLLEENFEELLDRVQYESNRIRRKKL
tara:strand:+ start:559 stop:1494 length:936 start_codon:yes stop_codon:yes gene_type:complete